MQFEHLSREASISPHEARLRLADDDLWILEPEVRFGLEGEEAVHQWTQAVAFMNGLANMAADTPMLNDATRQLLWDAAARGREALRRARERLEEEAKN